MLKIHYMHDCDLCTLLGNDTYMNKMVDIYICEGPGAEQSIMIRFGNEPSNFFKAPASLLVHHNGAGLTALASKWFGQYLYNRQ